MTVNHKESVFVSTCGYIGSSKYGAVAAPVPCQHGHGIVLPALQLAQLTGGTVGVTGVDEAAGLSQDGIVLCSGAGSPGYRHHAGDAVQDSSHVFRVAWRWRQGRKTSCLLSLSSDMVIYCNGMYI